MLADRRIALEICPTSNALTGAALTGLHAFVEFERAGCIVTIDADDPALFRTSHRGGVRTGRANRRQRRARALRRNAIDASFAGRDLKRALHAGLAAELQAVHRSTKRSDL